MTGYEATERPVHCWGCRRAKVVLATSGVTAIRAVDQTLLRTDGQVSSEAPRRGRTLEARGDSCWAVPAVARSGGWMSCGAVDAAWPLLLVNPSQDLAEAFLVLHDAGVVRDFLGAVPPAHDGEQLCCRTGAYADEGCLESLKLMRREIDI